MQTKLAKQWMQGVVEGKDPVSDMEKRANQKASTEITDQTLGAQSQMLNQQAMAQTGGAPVMAGQNRQAALDIAGAGQAAGVQHKAEGDRLVAALKEKRQAQGLAFGQTVRAQNLAKTATVVDGLLGAADVGTALAAGGGG